MGRNSGCYVKNFVRHSDYRFKSPWNFDTCHREMNPHNSPTRTSANPSLKPPVDWYRGAMVIARAISSLRIE